LSSHSETLINHTMLDSSYFNGDRDKDFRIFLSMVEGKKEDIRIRSVVEELLVDRLFIDKSIYDSLYDFDRSLLQYLLPWTKDSKCVERKHAIRYKFPLVDGLETEVTKIYTLDHDIFGIFWYAKLYTKQADYELFSRVRRTGFFSIDYEIPGSREAIVDGQLKIVTDAILCASNIVNRRCCRILVVGSSSAGYHSGLAYDILDHMFDSSVFELYDPEGVTIEYATDRNIYKHYAGIFDYSVSMEDYDMILDDAWDGRLHVDRDPGWRVKQGREYSIKTFPTDIVEGKIYHQLFKTNKMEVRLVSNVPEYDYRYVRGLGTCPACVELKYCMKGDYTPEFIEEFMSCHRINCRTGEYRSFFVGEEDVKLRFMILQDFPEGYKSKMYCLGWDYKLAQVMKSVPVNKQLLAGADILISEDSMLVNIVVKYARCVIKEESGSYYVLGKNLPKFMGGLKVHSNSEDQHFKVKRVSDFNIYSQDKERMYSSGLVKRKKEKKKRDFLLESKKYGKNKNDNLNKVYRVKN